MKKRDFDFERFRRYLSGGSAWLQNKYGLRVDDNCLQNETVRIRFSPGDVRDKYVSCSVSYTDNGIFREHARMKSFYLGSYIRWKRFDFARVFSFHQSSDCDFFENDIGKLMSLIHFLTWFGEAILQPDKGEVKELATYLHLNNVRYSEWASRPRTVTDDIKARVCEQYGDCAAELIELCRRQRPINVDLDPMLRSLLVVADGNAEVMRETFASEFSRDGRIIIEQAEAKLGHPKTFGAKPFESC